MLVDITAKKTLKADIGPEEAFRLLLSMEQ